MTGELDRPNVAMPIAEETLFDTAEYLTGSRKLRERFVVPPLSVMDASQDYWQKRKRLWLDLGIKSEVGRDVYTFAGPNQTDEVSAKILAQGHMSIFDPVLCEIAYRWWSPAGGNIADPFAGGSVRGVVAAVLERHYAGVELRPEQVNANDVTADAMSGRFFGVPWRPTWIQGDSANTLPPEPVDMLFTCPPYGNLEVYSDLPGDLSNMPPDEFADTYRWIIGSWCERLRDDRFAVFVVGNYRDPSGHLVDLVGLTVDAFGYAGCRYYSEVAYVSPVGSAAIRAGASFDAGRKPVRRHQTMLVFVKGDWRAAARAAAPAFGTPADPG